MIPRFSIIPGPLFPPVPCSTPASSRASCSYHRFSSRAISSVTGTSVIRRPSCASDERMNVAVSRSAPPDDASSSATVVRRSFSSPAKRTISRALTINASRSFSASSISSCVDCADVSTPRTRPSGIDLLSIPQDDKKRGRVAAYQCQPVRCSTRQFSDRLFLSEGSSFSYYLTYFSQTKAHLPSFS
jgi:hypothetical protein